MDEKKIKKLNDINYTVMHLTEMRDYAKAHKLDYSAEINVTLNERGALIGYNKANLPVDVRDILACLLLEKEELENEIKGEIKNEGN